MFHVSAAIKLLGLMKIVPDIAVTRDVTGCLCGRETLPHLHTGSAGSRKCKGADLKILDDIRSNTDQGLWPSAKARVFAGQKPRPTPACVCRMHLHTAATGNYAKSTHETPY